MRRDLASRRDKILSGKPIEQPVAQHLSQTGGPDFAGSFSVPPTRFRASGSREYIGHTLALECHCVHYLYVRAVRQTHRRLDFPLQFIGAG